MEAWIVHIRESSIHYKDQVYHADNYSAWSTEKQAYKAIAKFLLEATELHYRGPFVHDDELRLAVKALVEAEKIKEAIGLVIKYSRMEEISGSDTNPRSHKVEINIKQSKFLGSVWE